MDHLEVASPMGTQRVEVLVGRIGEAAGVDGEHARAGVERHRDVSDGHTVGLQTGHHHQPLRREAVQCPGDDLARGRRLEKLRTALKLLVGDRARLDHGVASAGTPPSGTVGVISVNVRRCPIRIQTSDLSLW